MTRLRVSAETATSASATARRAVDGLPLTSTIRGRPRRSTWVSRRRSARGASLRSMGPPARLDATRAWRRAYAAGSAPVEPAQLHLGARRGGLERLRDHRERIGDGERREHVAPLPAREPHADPALLVAHRRPIGVPHGDDALVAPAALALLTGSSRTARSAGRWSRAWPARRRRTGRTNSSKVTKLDTGLPGRPNSSTGSAVPSTSARPNANGLPGWTATRHRFMCPTASNAVRTTSYGPTETPPDDHDDVRLGEPATEALLDVLEPVDRDPEVQGLSAGVATSACRPGPLASGMPAGAEVGARRADLVPGREDGDDRPAADESCATPAPAASATTAGVTRSPGRAISAPSRTSPPIARTALPTADPLVDEARGRQRPRGVAPARTDGHRPRRVAS